MANEAPRVAIILAGPNGAGKSTLAPRILEDEFGIRTFVNADLIAEDLSPGDPAAAAIEAGRILHHRLEMLRGAGSSFGLETTLSGMWLRKHVAELHRAGYETHLMYAYVPSAEVAVARVHARHRMGGHFVPDDDVRRRYLRSIGNFERIYRRMVTSWRVYATARNPPELVAFGAGDGLTVVDDRTWRALQSQAASPKG